MTEKVSTINVKKGDEWETIVPAVAESAIKDGSGQTIALTYAKKTDVPTKTEVATALTDGSVTKIGTATLGSASKPIYLANGVPTVATNIVATDAQNVFTREQTIAKSMSSWVCLHMKDTGFDRANPSNKTFDGIQWEDKNGNMLVRVRPSEYGGIYYANLDTHDGNTQRNVILARSDGDFSSNSLVTKNFVANTTGGNNLMHRDGDEVATGWKTMNVVTRKGNMHSPSAVEYDIVCRIVTSPSEAVVFPFAFSARYFVFNGVGRLATDSHLTLRGSALGTRNMKFGVIVGDGGENYLVVKRTSAAGQSFGAWVPWKTTTTHIYAGYLENVPETIVPTEEHPFIEATLEILGE